MSANQQPLKYVSYFWIICCRQIWSNQNEMKPHHRDRTAGLHSQVGRSFVWGEIVGYLIKNHPNTKQAQYQLMFLETYSHSLSESLKFSIQFVLRWLPDLVFWYFFLRSDILSLKNNIICCENNIICCEDFLNNLRIMAKWYKVSGRSSRRWAVRNS